MKWGLKGRISIDADSGPPRYVLWYCNGICHSIGDEKDIYCTWYKSLEIGPYKSDMWNMWRSAIQLVLFETA